jgi:hypothetical protein
MDRDDHQKAAASAHRFAVRCNIGPGLRGYTFDSWRRDLVAIPPAIQRWLERGAAGHLVLRGQESIGKTHMAIAMLRRLWDSGVESLWYHDAARVDRDVSGAASAGSARILAGLTQSRVLLLDGLDRERLDTACLAFVEQIVAHRLKHGHTILATTREDPQAGPLSQTRLADFFLAAEVVFARPRTPGDSSGSFPKAP